MWTVTSGFEALAAHVVTGDGVDRDRARRELEFVLRDRFGIEHTTLQMEEQADRKRAPASGVAAAVTIVKDCLQ